MMTNYDYVQKAIDLFEDSLVSGTPIRSASELAGRVGYSTHYLGSLFQALCGESLGRYILRRRLSSAAYALREGSTRPSEAYMMFGWEDYSAFSRAVRKEFGVSPSALRNLDAHDIQLSTRARPILPTTLRCKFPEPRITKTEAIHVSGRVFFMGMNEKSYHRPWRIFMNNREKLRSVIGTDTYQFSSWDDEASSEDEGYWIDCATRTDPTATQEMQFFSREIPAMRVLTFEHTGPVETIHDTYRRIYSEYLVSGSFLLSGGFEYQHYGQDGAIRICLPVAEPNGQS